MMTSRLMPPILPTRSSSLALPSGFRTALSKSKNASASNVTFSLVGATTTGGGGGGAAGAGGGARRGAGGGAAGGGGGAFRAPSQSGWAVAGVQLASRQQSSLVPFFQGMPVALTQLSIVWAWAKAPVAEAARAADAKSDATLFSFFMILLSREGAVCFCKTSELESESTDKPPQLRTLTTRMIVP